MESLTLVFHASIPIDKNFLAKVKGVQAVNVELINESGTRYLATDVADDNFILRLLLRPFATTWDTTALDWVSGLYETYGTITFEMPTEIGSILDQTGHMPFANWWPSCSAVTWSAISLARSTPSPGAMKTSLRAS